MKGGPRERHRARLLWAREIGTQLFGRLYGLGLLGVCASCSLVLRDLPTEITLSSVDVAHDVHGPSNGNFCSLVDLSYAARSIDSTFVLKLVILQRTRSQRADSISTIF